MIDLRLITESPEVVRQNLIKRNFKDTSIIEKISELYSKIKDNNSQADILKNDRNSLSKQIGMLKAQGKDTTELMEKVKNLPDSIKEFDENTAELQSQISELQLVIPNQLDDSVPTGKDENFNVVVKNCNFRDIPENDMKPHWETGVNLGLLDFERASKLTGSRFVVLNGKAAQLERCLINFMLNIHTQENGYTEILPPFIVNSDSLTGTGQLPKFEEDLFKLQNTNYYLVPTAEVPLTNLFRNEIMPAERVPTCYCAYTPCFRAEAGSWGKDTRGIIRQHQFNKVELVKFVKPEESSDHLEKLLNDAESILKKLELNYRVSLLCSGDTGFSSSKTYDIEVWMPSQKCYREISSCSNFKDFQARRANIRFRRSPKDKPEFVHTINGSGLAVGRTLAAILENYQNQDGSVTIPEILQPLMNCKKLQ